MPSQLPEIRWIEAADNPWGVRLLDVRPITQGILSTSGDPQCAANAVSFAHDDGSSFVEMQPNSMRSVPVNLRYRIEQPLADGALFTPTCMEHKWGNLLSRRETSFCAELDPAALYHGGCEDARR